MAIVRERMKLKKLFPPLLFVVAPFFVSCFCFSKDQVGNKPQSIISFMGAPGAGKGTLAGKCVNELKYTSLSVGNLTYLWGVWRQPH